MTEETPIKAKPAKNRKFLLIRYGRMNNLGLFEHNESEIPRTATRVVVKTDKGLELGHLVGQLSHYKDGRFRLSEEQVASYYTTSEIQFNTEIVGKVVRIATPDDISEEKHLQASTVEEIESCERLAEELGLRMKIIDAEHIFGGERIVFYFMAEGRVDFRELVRKLAQEYQTRIEMRQIGSRDEAKLLGDVESCGRECCCLQFLQLLKPVNMRMAKMQKATLDPSKISGYCGRLKCCLRYEDQTYTELKQSLPKKGVLVQTEKGEAKVIDGQILTQLVMVEYPTGDRASYPVDELTVLPASAIKRRPPQEETGADANPRSENGEQPAARDPHQRRPGRDQRRPPRNDRRETFEEQQDARDVQPEASDEQAVESDRNGEDSRRENPSGSQDAAPREGNRRPENTQRPGNRDSRQQRPGRDQRRPPRNDRRETFEEQQDARDVQPETQEEQPTGPESDRESPSQDAAGEGRDAAAPEANRRSGNGDRQPNRDWQRRPGRDQRRPQRDERREPSAGQQGERKEQPEMPAAQPEASKEPQAGSEPVREAPVSAPEPPSANPSVEDSGRQE